MDRSFAIGMLHLAEGVLVIVVAYLLFYVSKSIWRKPLPAGPLGVSLLGNLAGSASTKPKYEQYAEWAKVYGDFFHLNVSSADYIILNSAQCIIDLLEKRSRIYSDRPDDTMSKLSGMYRTVFRVSTQNRAFQLHRKMIQGEFGPRQARHHWELQELKTREMLVDILESPVEWSNHVKKSASGTIMAIVYGYPLEKNDDPLLQAIYKAGALSGNREPGKWLVDSWPILQYLPRWFPGTAFFSRADAISTAYLDAMGTPLEWVKDCIRNGMAQPCMTTNLLSTESQDKDRLEAILQVAGAMFLGGSDTTHAQIEVFFLCMALNPIIQRRAQAELDSVMQGERLPNMQDWEDKTLPFCEALIKEVIRWHPAGYFGLPHMLIQEDVYQNKRIPRGSVVIANIWAVMHDEREYPAPSEFNPERFLPQTGEKAQLDPLDFAFGFGRRVCPGRHFAIASLFLAMTNVLATLVISILPGEEIQPEFTTAFVVSHPKPFKCLIKPRSEAASKLARYFT